MKIHTLSLRAAGFAVLLSAALAAGLMVYRFVSERKMNKPVEAVRLRPDDVGIRRARLNACARRLADSRPGTPRQLEPPAADVFQEMGPDERALLAAGAGRILDRLVSTNECAAAEVEWARETLSLLRVTDGAEAAALIRRVHDIQPHQIGSLGKLAQIESLMIAAYPERVKCAEAGPVSFERSAVKKAIIRKQLSLLKGSDQ